MPNFQFPLQLTVAENDLAEFVRLAFEMFSERRIVEPRFKTGKERSQHAVFGGQQPPEDQGLLIDTNQAAMLLNVSPKTVWRMETEGDMPKAIRIGRAVRWGFEEVRQWVDAGCPRREEWEKVWQKRSAE